MLVLKKLQGQAGHLIQGMRLILDMMEEVKKTPCDQGPDERTERGKHTRQCQSSGELEEMALLVSLLSLAAKEGCATLGMRWIGWSTDLRD